MKICAVIAEFNPFHKGHEILIKKIKKKGFTHIVAVMSGNFVQRGEPAIINKAARVRSALDNGVDLVIELPCAWVLSPAETYCQAAVTLVNALGCVDALAFGSERGNIQILKLIANQLDSQEFSDVLKSHLGSGLTFAKARQKALSEIVGAETAAHIKEPNNILAIEYLRALKKSGSHIKPITIKRITGKEYASASEIRKMIFKKEKFTKYVPNVSEKIILHQMQEFKAPCTLDYAGKALIYALRALDVKAAQSLPDISEGIENRLINAAQNFNSLEEILDGIKTKRYTMARIKRMALCVFLGITKQLQSEKIPYIRILGKRARSAEILKKVKLHGTLPLVSSYSTIKKLGENAKKIFAAECRAADIYALFSPKIFSCGMEQSFKMIKGESFDI